MVPVTVDPNDMHQQHQITVESWMLAQVIVFANTDFPFEALVFDDKYTHDVERYGPRTARAKMTSRMSHGMTRNPHVVDWHATKEEAQAALTTILWNASMLGLNKREAAGAAGVMVEAEDVRSRVLKVISFRRDNDSWQGREPIDAAKIPQPALTIAGQAITVTGVKRGGAPVGKGDDKRFSLNNFKSDTIWPTELFAVVKYLAKEEHGLSELKARYLAFKFVTFTVMMADGLSPKAGTPIEPYERGFLWDSAPLGL